MTAAETGTARRVLVCEDSRTFAAGLTRLLERGHELEVVGVCTTAEEAIARLPGLRPDLVTMDLELPGMSGVEAIEQIMSVFPVPILVLSGHVREGSTQALLAIGAGALDALPKRELDLADPDGRAAVTLRQRAKMLSGVKVIRHPRARLRQRIATAAPGRTASVIGICASTGGPQALACVLGGVPTTFPIPILVVQHMSAGFIEGFAHWLDGEVPLPVRMAAAGERAARGIWVAPEDAHLVLERDGRLGSDAATESLHRPSGDVLFRSLASACGRNAVAVVLTGMGRDGADGLSCVRESGGLTISQDEATSAIFGMPRAAAERGAEMIVPLGEIASVLGSLRPLVRGA